MKKIILDIDGVILDFNDGLANFTGNKYFKNPKFWNFSENGIAMPETKTLVAEFIDSKPQLKLINNNWINIFQKFKKLPVQVKIITGYPHIQQRRKNLESLGLNLEHIEIVFEPNESKASRVLIEVPDIIVEDNPEYLFAYTKLCSAKLYSPSLWNYNPKNNLKGVIYYNDPNEIEF